jgi:predicted ATPase/DNA-binding SARP family transcriptional activator
MSNLQLSLLGSPRIIIDGRPLTIGRRKAVALLANLAVTAVPHSREHLATMFWPEQDQTRAQANLRRTIYVLNQALGKGWLHSDRDNLSLASGYELDVATFLAVVENHRPPALETAVSLYQGDFLTGFTLRDAPEFDEWQRFQTEQLRHKLAIALQALIRWHSQRAEWEPALAYGRRWLTLDPVHEPAHRTLMQLYASTGRKTDALRQYERCVQNLADELGLYKHIKDGKMPPSVTGDLQFAYKRPQVPFTPLVGRQRERTTIRKRLEHPDCRLMTLAGPGGIGKTHLALAIGHELQAMFTDGVCFVSFVGVTAVPDDPASTIAHRMAPALNLTIHDSPLETAGPQLMAYLRPKQMLIILDNFDQLLAATPFLSQLLQTAAEVKILVTSRERLNVSEEWVLPLTGLDVPPDDRQIETYSAVQLFLHEVHKRRPDFQLTAADRTAVIQICRTVAGLPLALKLAAAWTHMLSCQEIAQEIKEGFDLLIAPGQHLPERHQSLQVVCQSSWHMLTAKEQNAFCILSVFPDHFDRQAAQAVTEMPLATLSALVDKSLLQVEAKNEDAILRYSLHPLLRRFAAAQFARLPGDEQKSVQARFARHYLHLWAKESEQLKGSEQVRALSRLEMEIENGRQAWRWAVAQDAVPEVTAALPGMYLYHKQRSLFYEGERLFRQSAAQVDEAHPLKGPFLTRQAIFASQLGQNELAQTLLKKSHQLARERKQGRELGVAALWLSTLVDAKQSWQLAEQAQDMFRVYGDPWDEALAWQHVGQSLMRLQQPDYAAQILQDALARYQQLTDRLGEAACLHALGNLTREQGDYETAQHHFHECLAIYGMLGDQNGRAQTFVSLGYVNFLMGAYPAAQAYLAQSLDIGRAIGSRWVEAWSLNNFGHTARAVGNYDEAQNYLELSLAICREINYPWAIALTQLRLGFVRHLQGFEQEAGEWLQKADNLIKRHDLRDLAPGPLHGFGTLAYHKGDYAQAEQQLKQCMALYRAMHDRWEMIYILHDLGLVALALQRVDDARHYFYAALAKAMAVKTIPLALLSLAGVARLKAHVAAHEADGVTAVTLLTFVTNHQATRYEHRQPAQTLLQQLTAELPPHLLNTALAQAEANTLTELAKSVLIDVE